jgi:hypothetical protein
MKSADNFDLKKYLFNNPLLKEEYSFKKSIYATSPFEKALEFVPERFSLNVNLKKLQDLGYKFEDKWKPIIFNSSLGDAGIGSFNTFSKNIQKVIDKMNEVGSTIDDDDKEGEKQWDIITNQIIKIISKLVERMYEGLFTYERLDTVKSEYIKIINLYKQLDPGASIDQKGIEDRWAPKKGGWFNWEE